MSLCLIKKLSVKLYLKHCQKNKFSVKDFFNKCDQILSFMQIWSHLLKMSWMENFIFCAVHMLILDLYLKKILGNFAYIPNACSLNWFPKQISSIAILL